MMKINNKETLNIFRVTSIFLFFGIFIVYFDIIFHKFLSVSIFVIEHVNDCWEVTTSSGSNL